MSKVDLDQIPDVPLRSPTAEAVAAADVTRFLQDIADLCARAPWATDTLDGIYETVRTTGRVTEGQRRAVANIEAAANRKADRPFRHARRAAWGGPPAVKPGHCRRCRRQLTDPESLRLGIGPECRELEGMDD